jgi:hypothetical protein
MPFKLDTSFHNYQYYRLTPIIKDTKPKIKYNFRNHFHPYIKDLLAQLNQKSLAGLMDVNFHARVTDFFAARYQPNRIDPTLVVNYEQTKINVDIAVDGAYSIYNWEMFFHVPLTIAVHLSKQQRFAESQRWFHFVFDPTSTDTNTPAPKRFWKFLAFRQQSDVEQINDLLSSLAQAAADGPQDDKTIKNFKTQIESWRNKPFQPHVIARTRFIAYQYQVVMKYLDNLIAWGDSLFRQDSIETINEATQLYVLAANILGPRPQEVPARGAIKSQNFRSLRNRLDAFGNALVEMEGEFPFNIFQPGMKSTDNDKVNTLLGLGQSLYFCIPPNDKLTGYWDLVADRLFKIRHCMNIEGIVRQMPLFEPPIDPGMLVRAAAAGIDISSAINGLNQPPSPVRAMLLIQKALEICSEVRNFGAGLLSAIEKTDGEHLALLRQQQDIEMQKLVRDARFLQWKESEANTDSLLRSRENTYLKYKYYQSLLGGEESKLAKQETLALNRAIVLSGANVEEIESNFDLLYNTLLEEYAPDPDKPDNTTADQAGASNPSNQSGATGLGNLHLSRRENHELNIEMPMVQLYQNLAHANDLATATLALIPEFKIHAHFWGLGPSSNTPGGHTLGGIGKIMSDSLKVLAENSGQSASASGKNATYERRSVDWGFQRSIAIKELRQIGQQILASLIREKVTEKEYRNQVRQVEISEEINTFIRGKFTNDELYAWMQNEIYKIYNDTYKFAFDVARQAEQAMKTQLMRPELDQRNFIKFNYWDSGRKGLLSGEGLYLDLKRMELAYHEHNKREYELVKHISLRQLNPTALLQLKATGTCEVNIPEWLFDLDCPGHYMRRIKTVALSIPCIAGPYTSINCTLSLQKSTIRKSPLLTGDEYARDTSSDDERFIDYYGTIQSIVTSGAQSDSGLFEVNMQDERLLPFEGSGAESNWRLELPNDLRQFNYDTISDVILHMRYTARQAGGQVRAAAQSYIKEMIAEANTSGMTQLFSLRHDFPNNWHQFTTSATAHFKTNIKKDHFPYFIQGLNITPTAFQFFTIAGNILQSLPLKNDEIVNGDGPLEGEQKLRHRLDMLNGDKREGDIEIADTLLQDHKDKEVFLLIKYTVDLNP